MDREAVKALIVKYLGAHVCNHGTCCLEQDDFIDFLARELAIDWREIFRRYMDHVRYGGEPGHTSASDWTPEEWAAIKPIYAEFFHLPPEPDHDKNA